nr:proton-translocating transhydrogenase family protein [Limnospira maxima]
MPPTLHTPLMSGANAISGIAVLGAIIIAGEQDWKHHGDSGYCGCGVGYY